MKLKLSHRYCSWFILKLNFRIPEEISRRMKALYKCGIHNSIWELIILSFWILVTFVFLWFSTRDFYYDTFYFVCVLSQHFFDHDFLMCPLQFTMIFHRFLSQGVLLSSPKKEIFPRTLSPVTSLIVHWRLAPSEASLRAHTGQSWQ